MKDHAVVLSLKQLNDKGKSKEEILLEIELYTNHAYH